MRPTPTLSPLGQMVRRYDPDRFFAALFAPAGKREVLFTLYAFNHELARAREVVREPMAALVRLQWWREVVEGARRRHEVAGPVGEALDAGLLHAPDLLEMIEGREVEADEIETAEAWCAYVRATAGGVAVAAGRALGGEGAALDAVRDLGSAYGVAGILRSVPALARQGRCVLPLDVLGQHGLQPEAVVRDPAHPGLRPVVTELAEHGCAWLQRGRNARPGQALRAAWLPAAVAKAGLRRLHSAMPGRPRLAMLRAALLGQ